MWLLALSAALNASPLAPAASSSSASAVAGRGIAAGEAFSVRLAERSDLLRVATLLHDSFSFDARGSGAEGLTFASARRPGWLDSRVFTARLALDIERRMTPWDWARHAQVVAESASGDVVGFAEVWGEDAASLANTTAAAPQPVLFNLCVAPEARRYGVARSLVARCEATARAWGDRAMFLKVRTDNEPAFALYEREGYALLETRGPAELPEWQERWKGGAVPLRLMSKPLVGPLERVLGGGGALPVPAKGFDEFSVSLESVLAYGDRDACVWFALLFARNLHALSPAYRVVPAAAAVASWVAYLAALKVLSGNWGGST